MFPVGQGVTGTGGPVDVRPSSHPLVGVRNVVQPVLVGDCRRIRRQRLVYLGRAADGGRSRGFAVGCRSYCLRRHAGQGLGVVPVVGEGHLYLDGLSLFPVGQGVTGTGGPVDVRPPGHPLVAVGNVVQPVLIGDCRRIRRQRLVHLGRASDGGRARCRSVGLGRHCRRHRDDARRNRLTVFPIDVHIRPFEAALPGTPCRKWEL